MTRGERKLELYFMDVLFAHLANAGSNDMDQSVFDAMPTGAKEQLKTDFDQWDQATNPEGYEGPKPFDQVADFEWAAYIKYKLKGD